MADVFISYTRRDREIAHELAEKLEKSGFSVWWDYELVGGAQFRTEINEELTKAGRVIVLWSDLSITSDWVVDEAAVGQNQRKLVPVIVGDSEPPLGFRGLHSLHLDDINSDPQLLIAALKGKPAAERPRRSAARRYFSVRSWPYVVSGLALVFASVSLWLLLPERSEGRLAELDAGETKFNCIWPTASGYAESDMSIRVDEERAVAGRYDSFNGKFIGRYDVQGHKMTGVWIQSGGAPECSESKHGSAYWGNVEFLLAASPHYDLAGKWDSCGSDTKYEWNCTAETDQ